MQLEILMWTPLLARVCFDMVVDVDDAVRRLEPASKLSAVGRWVQRTSSDQIR